MSFIASSKMASGSRGAGVVPDEEAEKDLGDDLCGWCGHSDRIIDHIDGDGKTVCTKCAEQEDNEEQQEAA